MSELISAIHANLVRHFAAARCGSFAIPERLASAATVGHGYSMHTFAAQQSTRVGAALWAAIRSLEEQERLASRMANEAGRRGNKRSETFHREKATESAAHAEALRDLLTHAEPVPEGSKAPEAQQSHETRDR
jgi:hypothetical protein